MPRNDYVTVPRRTMVLLMNSDDNTPRIQNRSPMPVELMATAGAVAPTSTAGSVQLAPYSIWVGGPSLSELWRGVPGATRVWAWSEADVELSVSHA